MMSTYFGRTLPVKQDDDNGDPLSGGHHSLLTVLLILKRTRYYLKSRWRIFLCFLVLVDKASLFFSKPHDILWLLPRAGSGWGGGGV